MKIPTRWLQVFQFLAVLGLLRSLVGVVYSALNPISVVAFSDGIGILVLSIIVLLLAKQVMDWT